MLKALPFLIVTNIYSAISFNDYSLALNKVQNVYNDIFTDKGAQFVINRLWDIDKINAKANRNDSIWSIDMWGGYPKHPLATKDGFMAFTCHEIGHHLGGFPFWRKPIDWASAEGQSDYFAAAKCLKTLWHKENNELIIKDKKIEELVKKRCKESFLDKKNYFLCLRVAQAGYEMMAPIAYKFEKLSFATPDTWVTTFIFDNQHPGDQCRLDTFLAGATCKVHFTIPFGQSNEYSGACKGQSARPRCWFLPSQGL